MLAKRALQLRLLRTTTGLSRCNFSARSAQRVSISTLVANARKPESDSRNWGIHKNPSRCSKTIWTDAIHPILLPPVVFVGLVIALWTWKCTMMVVFQNKIIYMPNVPPFARSERIEDNIRLCEPVSWELERIKSLDGTKLAVCRGSIRTDQSDSEDSDTSIKANQVIICYFQGNGGSLPPRLPMLSAILKLLAARSKGQNVSYTIFALSYRGYWTSSGRPSQYGIESDSQALLKHVAGCYSESTAERNLILWGQSIGSGVATTLTAAAPSILTGASLGISGLLMETPFTSIESMLAALYPQKWPPYRHLWPFLWNHWDSEAALTKIAGATNPPKILLLPGSRDEVVPSVEADKLETLCKELHLKYERKDVLGALHNEASSKRAGQLAIADFIAARVCDNK